ncbi:MAG: hypothetical protein COB69_04955 [Phycisphaera sp.]|nr:MAG: hypothetical protein COB69_04955 [Phycisphaera sp.]
MAKDTNKSSSKSSRGRRKLAIRRETLTLGGLVNKLSNSPNLGWAALIVVVFTALSATTAWWASTEPMLAVDDTAKRTVLARVPVQLMDEEATRMARAQARQRVPRVYIPDEVMIAEILTSLERLPTQIADAATVEDVDTDLRREFAIGTEAFAELKTLVDTNGQPLQDWQTRLASLKRQLERRPILDTETYRRENESLGENIQLAFPSARRSVIASGAINGDDKNQLERAAGEMASQAGIAPALVQVVQARLGTIKGPTFRYDRQTSGELQESAAARVEDVVNDHPAGAVIFRTGEAVTATQIELFISRA